MQNRFTIRCVVIAVVVVMVLSGLVAVTAASASGTRSGGIDPPEWTNSLTSPQVSAQVQSVVRTVGLSPSLASGTMAWLASLDQRQVGLLQHGAPLSEINSHATLEDINYYCLATSAIAVGAIPGAVFGSAEGPVGAILGFAAGAVVGTVIGYYACQQASNGNDIAKQWTAYVDTLMGAFGNQENLTGTLESNIINALNLTEDAWQRAADNAALSQLGNSSFSVPADEAQSGMAQQLSTVSDAYAYQTADILTSVITAIDGHAGSSSDTYGTIAPDLIGGTPPSYPNNYAASSGSSVIDEWGPYVTGSSDYYVDHGSKVALNCGTNSGVTAFSARNVVDPNIYFNTSLTCPLYGFLNFTWTAPSGAYSGITSVTGTSLQLTAGEVLPVAGNELTSDSGGDLADVTIGGGHQYAVMPPEFGTPSSSSADMGLQVQWLLSSTYFHTPAYSIFTGYAGTHLFSALGQLQYDAALNGEAYWSFLRSVGYNSSSQIPADCIVPEPYLETPSTLLNANLNYNESLSLYLAVLNGMAHFYNTSLNQTNFCGTQSKHQFHIGGAIWGNLFINATGDIYLNNGTSPVGISGQKLATETLGNRSTWPVVDQQLFLMPTLSTVSIPVGVAWAVPANDPVEVYAVQSGNDLWLNGNGTGGSGAACANLSATALCTQGDLRPLATLAPGDAIYLTSCVVGGSATNTCTVTVQTVNQTVVNITCDGPCSASSGGSGGGFFGIPNPFAWLANALGNLFGGGPLGTFLGSLLSDIILIGIVLALAYVAIVELGSWGRSKGGGNSGQWPSSRGSAGCSPRGTRRWHRMRRGAWHINALAVFGLIFLSVGALIALADGVVSYTGSWFLVFGLVIMLIAAAMETYLGSKR